MDMMLIQRPEGTELTDKSPSWRIFHSLLHLSASATSVNGLYIQTWQQVSISVYKGPVVPLNNCSVLVLICRHCRLQRWCWNNKGRRKGMGVGLLVWGGATAETRQSALHYTTQTQSLIHGFITPTSNQPKWYSILQDCTVTKWKLTKRVNASLEEYISSNPSDRMAADMSPLNVFGVESSALWWRHACRYFSPQEMPPGGQC